MIREIDILRAERDKAIADLEKIEPFLREREEFGQWQADALCRMLKIESGPGTMNEFNLEARWVKFSDRWPEAEETVLARNFKSGNIVSAHADDDECCPEAAVVLNGEYRLGKPDLLNWEWLEVREKERRVMENKTCGNCVWGSFLDDGNVENGVCIHPAPAWAELAEPTISSMGGSYDYARTCPFYHPQYGHNQEGGE